MEAANFSNTQNNEITEYSDRSTANVTPEIPLPN